MASKEDLLESIQPGMDLRWDFFKAVYSYAYTDPPFADIAIEKLEAAGCSKARQYYETWVDAYEADREAVLKRVADWYSGWNHHRTTEKEVPTWQEKIRNLSRPQLRQLLMSLLDKGIIEDPHELMAMMEQSEISP